MKNIFLIILIITGFSCREKVQVPAHLIQKEKMVGVLIDIHILESKINDLKLSFDSSRLLYNTLEQELFLENQITEELYRESYQYYTINIELMDDIYAIVVDSLNFMEKSSSLPRFVKETVESPQLDSLASDSIKSTVSLDTARQR